jgi:MtN3 and saliva related transmembrane protein
MSESSQQIIGIIAGILTSVALIPQVVKVYREKKSEQISIGYVIVLMAGQAMWIVYGFVKSDIPVVATNIFSLGVSIVMIVLGIKYKPT